MTDSEKLDLLLDKMGSIDTRLEGIDIRLDGMDNRLEGLENRADSLENRMDSLENRLEGLENRMDSLEKQMAGLDNRMQNVEICVADIKLTIENELRVNTMRVAEGHLDLSRKLNETIKIASDIQAKQEMQDIFLNIHEKKLNAFQLKLHAIVQ